MAGAAFLPLPGIDDLFLEDAEAGGGGHPFLDFKDEGLQVGSGGATLVDDDVGVPVADRRLAARRNPSRPTRR